MTHDTLTPAKFRRAAKIAIAKSVLEQITALNRTLAQAELIGCDIRLALRGTGRTSPEIISVFDVHGDSADSIYKDVFQ